MTIEKKKKSNSVVGRSLFMFTPHCIKLKLMFPWNISGLFLDGTINTNMGQESMTQAISVLSQLCLDQIFNPKFN